MAEHASFTIADSTVAQGKTADLTFKISESYCGTPIHLPLRVIRGEENGPVLGVFAAIHGDELNGTGIVRDLILHHQPQIQRGTLVLVPVVNMLGFERHSRYMPDRRDLNRCFPGSSDGSLASRFAHVIYQEIMMRCDCAIDLHTAANFRTNVPNVRANLADERAFELARAFGCELIINSSGPRGSLRRVASGMGRPVILLEAGEPWRIEPDVVAVGVQGIRNVLMALNMMHGELVQPSRQVIANRSRWVRATEAGLLHLHVLPGDEVKVGQPIATNTSLLGQHWSVLQSPVAGIVMGLTTLPSVKPGDPVCHIALPHEG